MMQTLNEQGEALRREQEDAVKQVRDEADAKLREQGQELQRAREDLEASQREAAQRNEAIRDEMQRLIDQQAAQNREDTKALKQQIAEMQTAHAAATEKSRQENLLLQEQITAANVEAEKVRANADIQVAKYQKESEDAQRRHEQKLANDQRVADNEIRREELEARKADREQQREDEARRDAKAEANTKNARDLAEIKEFKTSVETVGKKFTKALEQFQDLSTLTPDLLIKLADQNSYSQDRKTNFGEILGSETLRNIDGYIGGRKQDLEYIDVKFPNINQRELSPENQIEYNAVFQKLDIDRGKVERMDQDLTQDKLQTQAKTELYLKGINIDRNPKEFLKVLAENAARLTTIPDAAKDQLQSEITTAIANLANISEQKDNIVKIFDRLEPGLANFCS